METFLSLVYSVDHQHYFPFPFCFIIFISINKRLTSLIYRSLSLMPNGLYIYFLFSYLYTPRLTTYFSSINRSLSHFSNHSSSGCVSRISVTMLRSGFIVTFYDDSLFPQAWSSRLLESNAIYFMI